MLLGRLWLLVEERSRPFSPVTRTLSMPVLRRKAGQVVEGQAVLKPLEKLSLVASLIHARYAFHPFEHRQTYQRVTSQVMEPVVHDLTLPSITALCLRTPTPHPHSSMDTPSQASQPSSQPN
jgi:hypothetical protein